MRKHLHEMKTEANTHTHAQSHYVIHIDRYNGARDNNGNHSFFLLSFSVAGT